MKRKHQLFSMAARSSESSSWWVAMETFPPLPCYSAHLLDCPYIQSLA